MKTRREVLLGLAAAAGPIAAKAVADGVALTSMVHPAVASGEAAWNTLVAGDLTEEALLRMVVEVKRVWYSGNNLRITWTEISPEEYFK